MESHLDKKMENDMEAGGMKRLYSLHIKYYLHWAPKSVHIIHIGLFGWLQRAASQGSSCCDYGVHGSRFTVYVFKLQPEI